jgi:hypothetical protein
LLVIEGSFQAGEMVLTGIDRTPTGEERRVRGIWKSADGAVRETATDSSKTWKPWFDILFLPHRANLSTNDKQTDDKKTVAALDTHYQAAVQNNDTATMGRILADDFTLVTGSGKTYTKADLLNEARGGRVSYAHARAKRPLYLAAKFAVYLKNEIELMNTKIPRNYPTLASCTWGNSKGYF